MTYDEKLCRAVEKLGLTIEPGLDTSAGGEYVVYSYTRGGELWGDDAPCIEHRHWTMIYVAPLTMDRAQLRLELIQTIFDLFEAWPSEDPYSDAEVQRWVYQFDTIGGIDDGEA
ncbi:MAG: hypothetical protein IJ960_00895 [Oscillospiraceae bacterium]|nr:hypothetical protein [Oscillospiraceae bacterium]